jgi:hypothetical protein
VPCTEASQSVAHPCHILNAHDITGLTISVQKTKVMALTGREPVRSKTVAGNKIIDQVNFFNYLRILISYGKEVDIDNKLNKYFKITGIVTSMFRQQKTFKKTRIELYNTLAFPAVTRLLKLDHKNKRRKKNNRSRDEIYEKRAECTRTDCKTNTGFVKDLNITSVWGQNTGIQ